MGQQEVIDYLQKFEEGTVADIAKYSGIGNSSTSVNVKKCGEAGDIIPDKRYDGLHWRVYWKISPDY